MIWQEAMITIMPFALAVITLVALALAVALRARDAWRVGSVALLLKLARGLARRFVRRPLEFVFPPSDPVDGT